MSLVPKNIKCLLVSGIFLLMVSASQAQVTGGRSSFAFLQGSQSPYISAAGSIMPIGLYKDVSLFLQNPAMLQPAYHNTVNLSYNRYYADIHVMNLAYAWYNPNLNTNFGVGIQHYNYGTFPHTDINGINLGTVKASDIGLYLSASRKYAERWTYGATLKVAYSNLASNNAVALLSDVGVTYSIPDQRIQIGMVAKNMGFTVKKYNPNSRAEPLPFDMQLGIIKGLKNVPLRLFMVAHHLYEWDIRYNDPANIKIDLSGNPTEDPNAVHFVDKFFRHLNFGGELTFAKRVTATVAYSHLRRSEMGFTQGKGMAGFSFGLGVNLKKIQIQYGRSYYSTAGAYNELGLQIPLGKVIKTKGKMNDWGWNADYSNH